MDTNLIIGRSAGQLQDLSMRTTRGSLPLNMLRKISSTIPIDVMNTSSQLRTFKLVRPLCRDVSGIFVVLILEEFAGDCPVEDFSVDFFSPEK